MIRSTENQEKKFYLVSGGEWEAAVLAKDAVDASACGLEEAEEVDIDVFYVPSILADIGRNELASQLDEILRENQKKLDRAKMA